VGVTLIPVALFAGVVFVGVAGPSLATVLNDVSFDHGDHWLKLS